MSFLALGHKVSAPSIPRHPVQVEKFKNGQTVNQGAIFGVVFVR